MLLIAKGDILSYQYKASVRSELVYACSGSHLPGEKKR